MASTVTSALSSKGTSRASMSSESCRTERAVFTDSISAQMPTPHSALASNEQHPEQSGVGGH